MRTIIMIRHHQIMQFTKITTNYSKNQYADKFQYQKLSRHICKQLCDELVKISQRMSAMYIYMHHIYIHTHIYMYHIKCTYIYLLPYIYIGEQFVQYFTEYQ